MPLFSRTNRLSLKELRLHDRILDYFTHLEEYFIEKCEYNKTANFLQSSRNYRGLSLTMINNIPTDSVLPHDSEAFSNLKKLFEITLIEPQLNSSSLLAIEDPTRPTILLLDLASYSMKDTYQWMNGDRPLVRELKIYNIRDLNIFRSRSFNRLDAIERVVLQGTFNLTKEDLCIFVGINIQQVITPPIIQLNSTCRLNDWDPCAVTYIEAINAQPLEVNQCPENRMYNNCVEWAKVAEQCNLTYYEDQCSNNPVNYTSNHFSYNGSKLQQIFETFLSTTQTSLTTSITQINPTTSSIPEDDSMNIGVIIGVVCGLIAAIIILATTVFCIYRYHQNESNTEFPFVLNETIRGSASDLAHISIATSKTSKPSRYVAEKPFSPINTTINEVVPPLYTPPSESADIVSPYIKPSAPPAHRDSISTRTTHVYEAVDSVYKL